MIVILKQHTTAAELKLLTDKLGSYGITAYKALNGTALVLPNASSAMLEDIGIADSFQKLIDTNTPYQFASKAYKQNTTFAVNNVLIGNTHFNMVAGPCSVESEEQIFKTAAFLSKLGVKFIRGGAYKPRTSPYSFKGLGKDGLKLISKAAKQYNLNVVTELMDLSLLDEVMSNADIIQIGSRNMSNFYMLNELGKINKPVLLKRGMQAKISEWLLAADYILQGGNEQVILCERGIRSFDSELRNVMDIGAIALLNQLTHLPVWADPSHGTGMAQIVPSMAKAAVVAGANGIMVEIHPNPSKALSDAKQAISFDTFEQLFLQINLLVSESYLSKLQINAGAAIA